MSQIKVRNADGEALALVNIRIANGSQSSDQAFFDIFTDLAGNSGWPVPYFPDGDYTLYVNVANVDVEYGQAVVLAHSPSGDISIILDREPTSLARLIGIDSDAHRMFNANGEVVYGRGASAFLLFKKWLDGQDITPVLDQLQSLGCNVIRVMGMFESLGGFNPKAYPTYYDQIISFMRTCERYGLYVYWCCCAATGVWMTDDEAVQHVKRTVEQLKQCDNAIGSPVNEQGQHVNSIPLDRIKNEVDWGWMLHDMGSYGEDLASEQPFGTHVCLHTTRRYPGSVKDGNIVDHPNHVAQNVEVWIDEPYRMGDEGSGDRFADPKTAAEAAGSAYTALGWVVHSMQGERGDVLTGNTLDCARRAFAAMSGH